MPHNQKDKPEEIEKMRDHSAAETRPTWESDEMPHGSLPAADDAHAWRPSDDVKEQGQGQTGSEVLDESDDEWRPSDNAE
ncbi:MAG: hypothetical protein H0T73_16275 [Ardenticatenales bacterium]|nr:hypothetical protein [Ardenticatenales bacterium]